MFRATADSQILPKQNFGFRCDCTYFSHNKFVNRQEQPTLQNLVSKKSQDKGLFRPGNRAELSTPNRRNKRGRIMVVGDFIGDHIHLELITPLDYHTDTGKYL